MKNILKRSKALWLFSCFFIYLCANGSDKKQDEGKQIDKETSIKRKFTFGGVARTPVPIPAATQLAHAKALIDGMTPNSKVAVLNHAAQTINYASQTTTFTPAATVTLTQASSALASAAATQVTKHMRQNSLEHKQDAQKKETPPKQGGGARRPASLAVPHPTAQTPQSIHTPKSVRATPASGKKNHTRHSSLENSPILPVDGSTTPQHAYEWTAIALDALKSRKKKSSQARPRHDSNIYHGSPSVTPSMSIHTNLFEPRSSVYANYTSEQPGSPASAPAPASPFPQNPAGSMHMPSRNNFSDGISATISSSSASGNMEDDAEE